MQPRGELTRKDRSRWELLESKITIRSIFHKSHSSSRNKIIYMVMLLLLEMGSRYYRVDSS